MQHFQHNRPWYVDCPLIAVTAMVVFSNSLDNAFHQDDFNMIRDNPGIHQLWPITRHFVDYRTQTTWDGVRQYRPMLPLTLSINYAIAGDSLPGYHLTNLLFDILAAIAFYFLIIELFTYWSGRHFEPSTIRNTALALALVYAIHPVSGVLVNYLCTRDQILMSMFLFPALFAYVRMRRLGETALRWVVVIGLHCCAILSKTDALVFPALVLVFEFVLARESPRTLRPYLRALPGVLVVIALFAYTNLVMRFSDFTNVVVTTSGSVFDYPFAQARLHLFYYLRNFFWPFMMSWGPYERYWVNDPQQVIVGLIFISATVWLAAIRRRTDPLLSFSILAYWICFAPTSSILTLHNTAVDYRAHPSSPWLYLAMALLALAFIPRRVRIPLAAAVVLYVGVASFVLNESWGTEETLWQRSMKIGGSPQSHANYAMSINNFHDPRMSQHLEAAIRLDPSVAYFHYDYGIVRLENGDTARGIAECERARDLDPQIADWHYDLSDVYARVGRYQDAEKEFAAAQQRARSHNTYEPIKRPVLSEVYVAASVALFNAGEYQQCIDTCFAALRLDPQSATAENNLCASYCALEMWDPAIAAAEQALGFNPQLEIAMTNLAFARRMKAEQGSGVGGQRIVH